MEFGRRFNKLFSKDPIKKLDPLPHMQEPADPRISSRVVQDNEKLRRETSGADINSHGNPTARDSYGGRLHTLVDTSRSINGRNADHGIETEYKYPHKQRIVARLLKGFVNVDDIIIRSADPDVGYSYESSPSSIPRGEHYEQRIYAERFLLAHLFGSHEHYPLTPVDPYDADAPRAPHNLAIREGSDHMFFDFESAELMGDVAHGKRKESIIDLPDDAVTLRIIRGKLESMQKRYESDAGIDIVKGIFAEYADSPDAFRVFYGINIPSVEDFWTEFTTRIGTLLEKVRDQERKLSSTA